MKKITYLFLIILLLVGSICQASIEIERVVKFNDTHENTVIIPSRFGESFIDENTDLSALRNLEIHHVDLVYTSFKLAEGFDQQALNEQRMRKLIALLAQIGKKDPSWRAICQTGASTVEDAKTYFHGFILHVGANLNYESQAKFFESFQKKPSTKKVDNSKSTTLKFSSGTTIDIPTNAVVDKNGKPVKGEYDLVYQEFRDAADIVFSGIPMTYTSSGTEYNFSSVGMYEIRANQNGNELQLNKPIQIDFNATAVKDDVGFFKMDDNTGEWEKIEDIEFNKEAKIEGGFLNDIKEEEVGDEFVIQNVQASVTDSAYSWAYSDWNNHRYYILSSATFDDFLERLDVSKELAGKVVSMDKSIKHLKVELANGAEFNKEIGELYVGRWNNNMELGNMGMDNDMNATLLRGGGDAGHTYPKLVRGLNSPKFGVYNCDQIYRIGRAQNLTPTYVDAATGKEIKNKHVACVMDLTYNGAFSFSPNYVTCNVDGKNVILLFTKDKKTYMLDAEAFDKLGVDQNSRPVFAMTDMTDQLKSSKDLSQLLKL